MGLPVLAKLDNTVSAFIVDEETGELTLIGEPILASPPGVALSGEGVLETNRTTAEIAVAPDGRFVYVSERGDAPEDHISIFRRYNQSGELTFRSGRQVGGGCRDTSASAPIHTGMTRRGGWS